MAGATMCRRANAGSRTNVLRSDQCRASPRLLPVAALEAGEPPGQRCPAPGQDEDRHDEVAEQLEMVADAGIGGHRPGEVQLPGEQPGEVNGAPEGPEP